MAAAAGSSLEEKQLDLFLGALEEDMKIFTRPTRSPGEATSAAGRTQLPTRDRIVRPFDGRG